MDVESPIDFGRVKSQARVLDEKSQALNVCAAMPSRRSPWKCGKMDRSATARKRVLVARKTTAQADENLRVARDRYQHQAGTNMEVLDAETLRVQAYMNLYSSTYQAALAGLRLRAGRQPVMGGPYLPRDGSRCKRTGRGLRREFDRPPERRPSSLSGNFRFRVLGGRSCAGPFRRNRGTPERPFQDRPSPPMRRRLNRLARCHRRPLGRGLCRCEDVLPPGGVPPLRPSL